MADRRSEHGDTDGLVDRMERLAAAIEADPDLDLDAYFAEHSTDAGVLRAGLEGLRAGGYVPPGAFAASPALAALARSNAERYEIRERIGRGGMGVVHRAWDRHLRRIVALKTIRSDLDPADQAAAGSALIARFLDEARVTGGLEHPGIVPVHDLGVLDGRPFFTMKYVVGRPLSQLIAGSGRASRIDLGEAVVLLERACEALAFAHSRGIVHRDLKPANVMIGDYGEVYLMDWGLARRDERDRADRAPAEDPAHPARASDHHQSAQGDRIGTLEYMSPEQARGDRDAIDARTDVFGMGAILYHVLTGKAPYACEDREAGLRAAQRAEPIAPMHAAGTPDELFAVCRTAMSLDPAARYSTVRAFAEDLSAFRRGLEGRAWTDPLPRRVAKLVRRHPAATAIVLALSMILTIVIAGGSWFHVVETERGELAQRAREATLARELLRLSEAEGSPLDMRAHDSRYEASAVSILDLLASWDVVLDGSVSEHVLARRISRQPPRVSADLRDMLFLLAQHVGLSGAATPATSSPAAEHPERRARLSSAWPRILDVVGALGPGSPGSNALRAYAAWLVDPHAAFVLEDGPGADATPGEAYFCAWVIERIHGPAQAERVLERILASRPDLVWCHLRRGILALDRGDWSTALRHGTAAHALWPASSTARSVLGLAHEGAGDLDAAESHYRAAIERYPDDLANLFLLASLIRRHGGRGDLSESIELLKRAHCVAPYAVDAPGTIGQTLTENASRAGADLGSAHALELLLRAVRLQPHSWLAHYLHGCPVHLGSPEPADVTEPGSGG